MSANVNLLNAVNDQILKTANAKGILLKEEFGSVAEFQKFVIAFTIRSIMEVGNVSVSEAYDLVMGDGSYKALANDIWETLQSAA